MEKKIESILELITAVFEDKKIYFKSEEDSVIFHFTFDEFKYPNLLEDKNFKLELEYGLGGNVKDFIKLNNLLTYFKNTGNLWYISNEEDYVFPKLKDLYYE